jgi:hypothetical protein
VSTLASICSPFCLLVASVYANDVPVSARSSAPGAEIGEASGARSYAVFFRATPAKRDTAQLHHAYSGSVARAHAVRVMQEARATMIPEPRRSMANLETTGGGLSAVTTARIVGSVAPARQRKDRL